MCARALAAALAVLSLAAACAPGPNIGTADVVLRNGRIVTLHAERPEAQAVAMGASTVLAVGTDAEIKPFIGERTEVVDLGGRLAVPGFIESHGHFVSLGSARRMLDFSKAASWDEIVAQVAGAVSKAQPGDWILGRGWHQEKWQRPPTPSVEGFPTYEGLSRISPNNPVFLTHASGHASFVNRKAMDLAGITRRTPNPAGGEILRDPLGNATGLLREAASGLVRQVKAAADARRTPAQVEAEMRRDFDLAIQEIISNGITTFQDAGASFETVDLMKRYADEDRLPVRLWVMLQEGNEQLSARIGEYRLVDYGRRLTVRAIKRVIDGALGSRGAWLLEPYSDLPSSKGLNVTPIAEIEEAARIAVENGFQLCVHAIGDRANRETLDLFERTFAANPGRRDLRWRIEHAQHLHPADIPRFGRLRVIASMQGIHATSDGPWIRPRLGEQRAREGAYVWQSLLKTGARIANGTDAPVEDVSPVASFYASVSRKLKDGSMFYPEQRMTREQALRSYTLDAAYAAFEEDIKGSIVPGKRADITVLSKDIMRVPEDEIPTAEVLYTIVGGRIMYRR